MTKGFKRTLSVLLAFLLIVAVLSGGKTLYYFLFTTGIIWIGMILMLNHNERNLYILYYTSDNTVQSGDAINIDYKISNTSFVPILHAVIEFKLDKKMDTESSLKEIAYFGNYHRINFSKDIVCKYRGYYKVGKVKVELYDPLLLGKRLIDFNKEIDITVQPKVVPIRQKLLQSQDFYGTLKSNQHTLEDRTNIINIRPYIPGDQLKNIHWKVSAKKDALQTKEFEQTVSTKLMVLLDGSKPVNLDLDREEKMVSFVASLVKMILDDQIDMKLIVNDNTATVIDGGKASDFYIFLDQLTNFECLSDVPFEAFVHKFQQSENTRTDQELILVTQELDKACIESLSLLTQKINVFTFMPKDQEERALIFKYQTRMLRFHYIDQIMDVTYGQ
jgi:Uncharacterized conserved protein (some members contain a von Willebrand factor type A (vWA) domain)